MEKIKNLGIEFQETSIFSSHTGLVVNYSKGSNSVFDNAPILKVLQLKEQSPKTKSKSSQGQAKKYTAVTQFYDVAKKSYPNPGNLLTYGKVGFQNLGNTCYMNSALQCVLRIEPLAKYFLRNQHLQDLNVVNVLGSEGYLACAFGQLVKTFYTTGRRALQPSAVLRVIAKNPQFRGYNHQDSQQFLNYFLDKLHQDLNKIRDKPYTEDIQSDGRPDEIVSKQSWDNYQKRNNSVIVKTLAGQYRSQIRCPDCNRLSITFDPFLSLTLQFPRPQKSTQVSGFIMSEEGEFQKLKVDVRSSMPAYEFYDKFFHTRPYGVVQKEKRITHTWDENLTVFKNIQANGALFFYERPIGHNVKINLKINSPGVNDPQNFVRLIFAKNVIGEEELLRLIFISIRKPLQKATDIDQNTQDYINKCKDLDFIKIRSIQGFSEGNKYPITGSRQIKVEVELDQSKLKLKSPIRLNVSGTNYEGKKQPLVRKVGNKITMQQLLQCFSQPERLTQQNAWYCNVCKDHKLAQKAMQLYRSPKFLIVHLKRFNHRGDSGNRYIIYGEKVSTPIELQEFQMILGKRYELIGVVNHIGSLMYGHYMAMVKRDEWYNYDDSRCSRTRLDGGNAYLLFYQQVE